mmetsp:Transcript_143498/g.357596  ORF Transcript_143498/g.357596 Transcript_143498/m.357596 type:complete len:325 (+) Transcript_143498:115-1089(+)
MAPAQIVDPHLHFFDPATNPFNAFLGSLGAPTYLPEQYAAAAVDLPISKSVHVEAVPDDGLAEAQWVNSLADQGRCSVAGIVASCDLSASDVATKLDQLSAVPRVRGIRYILDYDGPYDGKNPTHRTLTRHGNGKGVDFLRDATEAPKFEKGFAMLSERGLSFDLQCAPAQLLAAAALLRRHPGVTVCIDHLGKLHHFAVDGSSEDERKLAEWRQGMLLMAELPQVYVKLSMLGHSVPGWHTDIKKEEFLRSLVREVIDAFGAHRCMFASNWHINAAVSCSDHAFDTGLEMPELYARFETWVADLPETDRHRLFAGTASEFYRI